MAADCLKLTSYFGERHRSNGRFLADALLDLYEQRQVAASVMVRGALGFGLGHHVRTDRLLTLSEDLPVVTVAVDERARIEALAEQVVALTHSGVVTLERAHLLAGRPDLMPLPEPPGEQSKLTVYLGRQERVAGRPGFVAVCDLLHRRGISGATVLLGVDGTTRGARQRARFFARNANVPLMIIAIGGSSEILAALPELVEMLREPLLTLERVTICKRDGELMTRPGAIPQADEHGLALWQKLMVYSSEQAQHDGGPQHQAIVEGLRRIGTRGATVLRGVWGFHGDHPPHGDKLLQLRRHVPTVTIVVDEPARVAEAFEVIDAATRQRGLVTCETVPAFTALARQQRHGGLRLARRLPHAG
jgi:PII-like signaling protein